MSKGKREIWIVEDFNTLEYDFEHRSKYAVCPSDVSSFINDLESTNKNIAKTCKEHLKNIFTNTEVHCINWDNNNQSLKEYIKTWYQDNYETFVWDGKAYRFLDGKNGGY